MKMVDRIFPGSGVNSFLRQNGMLRGMGDEGSGEVKRLEDVASVSEEEKSELIEPVGTVPVTTKDIIESNEDTLIRASGERVPRESYTCPCKKCKGEPAKDIKEVWDKFTSKQQKDTFVSGRKPKNVIETIDKAAENFKRVLTGSDKKDKNVVEGFCNEYWHEISTSLVIVIAIVFVAMSIFVMLTLVKCAGKCCKNCCCSLPKQSFTLTGGNLF